MKLAASGRPLAVVLGRDRSDTVQCYLAWASWQHYWEQEAIMAVGMQLWREADEEDAMAAAWAAWRRGGEADVVEWDSD